MAKSLEKSESTTIESLLKRGGKSVLMCPECPMISSYYELRLGFHRMGNVTIHSRCDRVSRQCHSVRINRLLPTFSSLLVGITLLTKRRNAGSMEE
jgi:hypothetical protein